MPALTVTDAEEVEETFRLLALPDLRDWLRRNRTGRGTYPLVAYHRFVAVLTLRYLQGWGWTVLPLGERAQRMLDGVHVAALDAAVVEVWPHVADPLDGYSRRIARKYAAPA